VTAAKTSDKRRVAEDVERDALLQLVETFRHVVMVALRADHAICQARG